jgi:hypothetical protein
VKEPTEPRCAPPRYDTRPAANTTDPDDDLGPRRGEGFLAFVTADIRQRAQHEVEQRVAGLRESAADV